jgi:hypothetical protein
MCLVGTWVGGVTAPLILSLGARWGGGLEFLKLYCNSPSFFLKVSGLASVLL